MTYDWPLIYVSGPLFSSGTPAENIEAAMDTAHWLVENKMAFIVPHLSYFMDPEQRYSHETWMQVDCPAVVRCDAVLLLPGVSRGATEECLAAVNAWVPIHKTRPSLLKWKESYVPRPTAR